MARTNVDIDDEACAVVMQRYQLNSKREAINYALRLVAGEALDVEEARALRGTGWEGDLDEMRSSRSA
ncbi:MAG: type II toxin-antitoxin system VapB family antitoxin [Acidimicrobiia bacterium]